MAERYDEEMFLGYLEGDLTPEQIAQFEKVLVEDARLRNLVAQLVLDRHRTRNLPKELAPPELMERVNQQLERRMLLDSPAAQAAAAAAPVRRLRYQRVAVGFAVAALVVIVGSVIIYVVNTPVPTTRPVAGSGAATDALPASPAPTTTLAKGGTEAAMRRLAGPEGDSGPHGLPALPGDMGRGPGARGAGRGRPGGRNPPMPGRGGHPGIPKPTKPIYDSTSPLTRAIASKITGMQPDPEGGPDFKPVGPGAKTPLVDAVLPGVEDMLEAAERQGDAPYIAQPSGVHLVLKSNDAAASEQAIRLWAKNHDVTIEGPARAATPEPEASLKDSQEAFATPRVVLVMEQRQLMELVMYLKQDARQTVRVAQEGAEAMAMSAIAAGPAGAAPTTQPDGTVARAEGGKAGAAGGGGGSAAAGAPAAVATPPAPDESAADKVALTLAAPSARRLISPYAHVTVPIFIQPATPDLGAKANAAQRANP